MFGAQELILLLVLGLGFLGVAGYLLWQVAHHSYRRGYNPAVWTLAAIVALNPIFLLVVLASVPHRSRLRLRARFAAELDAKLAKAGRPTGMAKERSATAETQTAAGAPAMDATRTYRGGRPSV
jgi:hypothetical protein